MPENDEFVGEVNNHAVEGIDVHGLVANNQLPIAMLFISQDKHVGIGDVQLVSHVDDKLTIKFFSTTFRRNNWVVTIHSN